MADKFTFADLKDILVTRVGMDEENVPTDLAASFEDAGLDSLAILELQLEVEQRYGFQVPEGDTELIKTLGDAIDYVNRRLSEVG